MDAVILKGRADGFELQLTDSAAFSDILTQLDALLGHLYQDTPSGDVNFVIETGRRLLTAAQKHAVDAVFAKYPRFSTRLLHSDVVDAETVQTRVRQARTNFAGGVIRSGQVLAVNGDLVFTGVLHANGVIRASGSVFVLGTAEGGVVHAGYPDNSLAVAAGRISDLAQIRIADAVEVVEDEDKTAGNLCYMSDEHMLVHADLGDLATLRPQIFKKMEES